MQKIFISFALTTLAFQAHSQTTPVVSTSQTEIIQVPVQRPLKASFLTASYASMENSNQGKGEVSTYSQLRLDYKLANSQSVRFNQLISTSWGSKGESKIADPYLQYAKLNLVSLPYNFIINTHVRAFFPLSETSQERGQSFSTRVGLELYKEINKNNSISLHLMPTYNFSSRNSYLTSDGSGGKIRKPNNHVNLWYYLSATSAFSEKWSFTQDLGLMRYWFRSDSENNITGITKEYFYADSGITYTINDNFDVGGGLSSYLSRDMLAQKNQFSIYRSDETDYYLTASMRY